MRSSIKCLQIQKCSNKLVKQKAQTMKKIYNKKKKGLDKNTLKLYIHYWKYGLLYLLNQLQFKPWLALLTEAGGKIIGQTVTAYYQILLLLGYSGSQGCYDCLNTKNSSTDSCSEKQYSLKRAIVQTLYSL